MNVAWSAALQAAVTWSTIVFTNMEFLQMQAKSVMLQPVAPMPFSSGVV